ncbi:MAG: hypothetical protein AAF489_11860 [Bacteroidota bacterium]
MTTHLPIYVYVTFFAAIVFVLSMFYYASNKNIKLIIAFGLWGVLHSVLAISGFYENTKTLPPRLMLVVFPVIPITMTSIFLTKMKDWMGSLKLKQLMYLHAVRIPVELTLFWLCTASYVPELITFQGRNFDILAGISAPLVALIAFRKEKWNKPLLWGWHIMSILLLVNVVVHVLLATPTVIQQVAFEQPNVAVLKFPFLLLPGIIVPVVLISNIAGFVILKRAK